MTGWGAPIAIAVAALLGLGGALATDGPLEPLFALFVAVPAALPILVLMQKDRK